MKTAIAALVILVATVPMARLHGQDKKTPPAAKVAVTAELVCAHCDLGLGDDCAPALKVDKKTAIFLAGKPAKEFEDKRFDQKFLVAEGALALDKKKQMVLTLDKASFWKEGDTSAPAKGTARATGTPVCGSCDLMICDECTLAVANGAAPIILDGKLATQHKAEDAKAVTVLGQFYVDKNGLLRLNATKVDLEKK